MEKLEKKKELLNACIEHQKQSINTAQKAIASVQESVAEEKSSIEDSMESFRESLQNERDMYARQVQEGIDGLSVLNRINIVEHNTVKLGSVVKTNLHNYFVSISLGEIKADGEKYLAISTQSPLFQLLSGKKKGDTFQFRTQNIQILDVF
jgi:transcription elongation GreA/GreB family factor